MPVLSDPLEPPEGNSLAIIDDAYLAGSFKVVATEADRDALSVSDVIKIGTLVKCQESGIYWRAANVRVEDAGFGDFVRVIDWEEFKFAAEEDKRSILELYKLQRMIFTVDIGSLADGRYLEFTMNMNCYSFFMLNFRVSIPVRVEIQSREDNQDRNPYVFAARHDHLIDSGISFLTYTGVATTTTKRPTTTTPVPTLPSKSCCGLTVNLPVKEEYNYLYPANDGYTGYVLYMQDMIGKAPIRQAYSMVAEITVSNTGVYSFQLAYDNYAELYIDCVQVYKDDGTEKAKVVTFTHPLTAGKHCFILVYQEEGRTGNTPAYIGFRMRLNGSLVYDTRAEDWLGALGRFSVSTTTKKPTTTPPPAAGSTINTWFRTSAYNILINEDPEPTTNFYFRVYRTEKMTKTGVYDSSLVTIVFDYIPIET